MPHTGDMALGFVLQHVVFPLVHIYRVPAKFKPFPCLLLYGCGAHKSAPFPISGLTLSLDFLEHLNLVGSFTSPCLCSCYSLYMQHPLFPTVLYPKYNSLWSIPSLMLYSPTAVLVSEFLEDQESWSQWGTRAWYNTVVTTTNIHLALTTHMTLFQAYVYSTSNNNPLMQALSFPFYRWWVNRGSGIKWLTLVHISSARI